jgi:hypothetical protein
MSCGSQRNGLERGAMYACNVGGLMNSLVHTVAEEVADTLTIVSSADGFSQDRRNIDGFEATALAFPILPNLLV